MHQMLSANTPGETTILFCLKKATNHPAKETPREWHPWGLYSCTA